MEIFTYLVAIGMAIWLIRMCRQTHERLSSAEQAMLTIQSRLNRAEVKLAKLQPIAPTEETHSTNAPPSPSPVVHAEKPPAKSATAPFRESAEKPKADPVHREPKAPPPLPPEPAIRRAREATATLSETNVEDQPTWTPILQKLNLLPPSGENAEAALASWWLTRIGLVILIIAAVFFGVRVASDVPPIVRVLTVATAAVGMVWAGTFLETRVRAFGRLVSSGGLALGYFTAFAAYGIPGMKVIDSPVIGLLIQAAAVAAIMAWSIRKNDERVAAMAVLLGYVACGFSHAHDLDQFVVIGLLLLAAGGGWVQIIRGWLWPIGIATAGSWGGFLILGLNDWSQVDASTSLSFVLISLFGLMALLEAISFLSEDRDQSGNSAIARARHWLAIANTSLAALVSWIVVRSVFPAGIETTQLDAMYLVFAIGIGLFSCIRFVRKHSLHLTQAYFLKASALLALFLVEAFDGPTRWLSLSIQTGVLLWAHRQSGLRWIEIGFAALFACSLASIVYDLGTTAAGQEWSMLGVTQVIGAISLVILSTALALHAKWNSSAEHALPEPSENPFIEPGSRTTLRALAALVVGAVAWVLASPGMFALAPESGVVFLSGMAVLLSLPAIIGRGLPSAIAGMVALCGATVGYCTSAEAGGLASGLWLATLGFGGAELTRHLWKSNGSIGDGMRMTLNAVGVITLGFLFDRTLEGSGWLSAGGLIGYAAIGAWAMTRQSKAFAAAPKTDFTNDPSIRQWVLSALVGFLILVFGHEWLRTVPLQSSWLALAAGVLFLAILRMKTTVAALAGGIPLVGAVASHWLSFGSSSPIGMHLAAASMIVAVCSATAVVLWKRIDSERFRPAIGFDAILHLFGLLVLHGFFQSHFSDSQVMAVDCLIGLGLVCIHLRFPLPTLHLVSVIPMILGGLGVRVAFMEGAVLPTDIWWTVAAGVTLAWLAMAPLSLRRTNPSILPVTAQSGMLRFAEGLAALLLTLAGWHAAPQPWPMVILAGFGVALATLGRKKDSTESLPFSFVPIAAAIWCSLGDSSGSHPDHTLLAIIMMLGLLVSHGWVLYSSHPERHGITWIHGLLTLLLLFPALSSPHIGVETWTTLAWGAASIALFIAGLAGGLRPYRLSGLIGLLLTIGRMFIVDIDDALGRIYAFFGIAIVLLGMGYLYQRFRHLIDGTENGRSED